MSSEQVLEKSGSLSMRPRARLISLIGDELISDEGVALVELVKNSYDADATSVSIIFPDPDDEKSDTLFVTDNGIGMTLQTVLEGWCEPGTVFKKRTEHSPGGRLYQGAKGVGRFAAARLAEGLFLTTKTEEEEGVTVLLDWGKFNNDSYLDEVSIEWEQKTIPDQDTGTTLHLVNLKKEWSIEDYQDLHSRLSKLISPFDTYTGKSVFGDFEINLEIPNHPQLTGKVQAHQLTKNPKYLLKGKISSNGFFNGSLLIDDILDKEYIEYQLGKHDSIVSCGSFAVEIRAWDRDKIGLSPYMLKYSMNISGVRRILNNYCGVSIYRDFFRVYPYGEKGNDWLSLDPRSRQNPTLRLANNQIIAAIGICRDENPMLLDRTTREGLVHNSEYTSLQEWFHSVLLLLESRRYEVRPRKGATAERLTTLYEPFDLSEIVTQSGKQLGIAHPVTKLVKTKDVEIRSGVLRLQEHYSRVLLAAGLGQLVDLVIHEIGAPLGKVNRELNHLEKIVKKLAKQSSLEELDISFSSIRAWLEQIGVLRGRLDPKTTGKRERVTTFSVQDEIQDNVVLYQNLLSKQGINLQVTAPTHDIIVHMPRSHLGQVFANLLDNAVYWLTRSYGDGGGGNLLVELNSLEYGFSLLVCDDGPGIMEEHRSLIFEQNFTLKPHGMGLGLYIAREVIEPYGKLVYRDECKLDGACFEASFERRVGHD